MAFEERTERRPCPTCGAKHVLHWYRIPVRESCVVHCLACKKVMHTGKGVFECDGIRLDDVT